MALTLLLYDNHFPLGIKHRVPKQLKTMENRLQALQKPPYVFPSQTLSESSLKHVSFERNVERLIWRKNCSWASAMDRILTSACIRTDTDLKQHLAERIKVWQHDMHRMALLMAL